MPGPFQTPQNEKSFSGLIDQVLIDTGRPGSLLSAVQYGNATLLECHALGLFYQDLLEDQIPTTAQPMIWAQDYRFRQLRTVQYNNTKEYPDMRLPGRAQQHTHYLFYAADDYFVFKGTHLGEMINLAYYRWPASFLYYTRLGATNVAQYPGGPYVTRPAYYDKHAGWKYLNADGTAYVTTLNDPAAEAIARGLVMNWMLGKHYELIQEGTKNKIFNLFGDPRANGSFSLYKSMQSDLVKTTQYEGMGV